MKYSFLKYAPKLSVLLETFHLVCDNDYEDLSDNDNYLQTLQLLGIIEKNGLFYRPTDEWHFLIEKSGDEIITAFREKISHKTEVKDILRIVSEKAHCEYKDIYDAICLMDDATLQTWLGWMTDIHLLSLSGNEYVLYTEDAEEEDSECNKFISNEKVNIKEDKFSVFEYCRKIKKGHINMNPDFQRNLVWSKTQKSRFIESALMNLPLPPIYLKKESDTKFIVVDGLQRSAALSDFIENKFALYGLERLSSLNGCTFDKLDSVEDGLSARLEDCQLNMYVMQPSVSMSLIYDLFNRINTGGTQLNRQEIRNCILKGKSTTLLRDLSFSSEFRESVGNGIKPKRMKDREVLLRCIAFAILSYEEDYSGYMDEFLEKAMRKLNKMTDLEIEKLKSRTLQVFNRTYRIFLENNFRIPTYGTRGRINIAVLETVFLYFFNLGDYDDTPSAEYRERFTSLLKDEKYLNAVRWSTGSKTQVNIRFEISKLYLSGNKL